MRGPSVGGERPDLRPAVSPALRPSVAGPRWPSARKRLARAVRPRVCFQPFRQGARGSDDDDDDADDDDGDDDGDGDGDDDDAENDDDDA
eukprot:2427509-Pyramimonas_sp.AAC.1